MACCMLLPILVYLLYTDTDKPHCKFGHMQGHVFFFFKGNFRKGIQKSVKTGFQAVIKAKCGPLFHFF